MALDSLVVADTSSLSFNNDPTQLLPVDADLDDGWSRDNFVGLRGYPAAIDTKFREVHDLWVEFVKLPTDVLAKYDGGKVKYQRGVRDLSVT